MGSASDKEWKKREKNGMSYEERLARVRSGGGAAGLVGAQAGQQRPRVVPPPPPGQSNEFTPPPARTAGGLTGDCNDPALAAPPAPARGDYYSPAPAAPPPAPRPGSSELSAKSASTAGESTTHIQFSRFTDSDKQAFFALLDEFFAKRATGGDLWYV